MSLFLHLVFTKAQFQPSAPFLAPLCNDCTTLTENHFVPLGFLLAQSALARGGCVGQFPVAQEPAGLATSWSGPPCGFPRTSFISKAVMGWEPVSLGKLSSD